MQDPNVGNMAVRNLPGPKLPGMAAPMQSMLSSKMPVYNQPYLYANGNPLHWTDPRGEWIFPDLVARWLKPVCIACHLLKMPPGQGEGGPEPVPEPPSIVRPSQTTEQPRCGG